MKSARPLLLFRSSLRRFATGDKTEKITPLRLKEVYANAKLAVAEVHHVSVDPRAVFVNNELNLKKIDIYGFDYDYTLAVYTRELNVLIYNLAMNRLIKDFHYPDDLFSQKYQYDKEFAIRGLHYDIQNCILLKMDAFSQIQKGTVFRGRKQLTDDQVSDLYGGWMLPDQKGKDLPQLIDLFSLPWAGLLSTTVQYFDDHSIIFDPYSLYHDIAESVKQVHVTGELYEHVTNNLNTYVHSNPGLNEYLHRLHDGGKQMFMVTNSPFEFMNTGMTFMLGDSWRKLFAHVVVQARKPTFFQAQTPFRLYNEVTGKLSYEKVTELLPGKIYAGGNIEELSNKANFGSKGVLYMGDHIYTDLADPMLTLGWHTAAIVPELAREIRAQNQDTYRVRIQWLETLTHLIERYQSEARRDVATAEVLNEWVVERKELRSQVKHIFNPQFGSIFRTYHNMTYFSRRLSRLADVYTSRLPNLLKYDIDHAFFPRRNALPHENLNSVPLVSEAQVADAVRR